MPVRYNFRAKSSVEPYSHSHSFKSEKDAVTALKSIIKNVCKNDLACVLRAISHPSLPSPNYRKSVYNYLRIMFLSDKMPSYSNIDYSDYEGNRQGNTFEEIVGAGDFENNLISPINTVNNHGFFYNYDFDDPTHYERCLGFIFAASKHCMRLVFNNFLSVNMFLYQTSNSIKFRFYGETVQIDVEIERIDGVLPPSIEAGVYRPILLSLLQDGMMRPIGEKFDIDAPESTIKDALIRDILARLNNENCSAMIPKLSFSTLTIERAIESFKKLGYNIAKAGGSYYLPPLIKKSDADLILEAIKFSALDENEKDALVRKFTVESGIKRHEFNEETEFPLPKRLSRDDKWTDSEYPIIIYNMLRLCARPLLRTSDDGEENLQDLIETNYGVHIRRQTISSHISSMIQMGLPIKKEAGKVSFDTSGDALSIEDVEKIKLCISESKYCSDASKNHLISTINSKFPFGKY